MKIRLIGVNRLPEREALDLTQLLDSWLAHAAQPPATLRRCRAKLALAILAAEQRASERRTTPPGRRSNATGAPR